MVLHIRWEATLDWSGVQQYHSGHSKQLEISKYIEIENLKTRNLGISNRTNFTWVFTLPRPQPYNTQSYPDIVLVVKIINENPDFLQALTNKGVNLVDRKDGVFMLKSFGNQ
jgi:hypothetical protein